MPPQKEVSVVSAITLLRPSWRPRMRPLARVTATNERLPSREFVRMPVYVVRGATLADYLRVSCVRACLSCPCWWRACQIVAPNLLDPRPVCGITGTLCPVPFFANFITSGGTLRPMFISCWRRLPCEGLRVLGVYKAVVIC